MIMDDFETLCAKLKRRALARENLVAKGIRNAVPTYAKILNDQDCIKAFVGDMLKIDGYEKQLDYSKNGQLRIYNASYEIIGANIKGTISDERWRDMLDIGNAYLDKNNGKRDKGLDDRMMGILLEEVGEKVLDYNIDKTDFSNLFSVEKSNNVKWDTKIKFTNPYLEANDGSFYYDLRSGLQLDHKTNIDNFHITDRTITDKMKEKIKDMTCTYISGIQAAVMTVILPYKMGSMIEGEEDSFPIYYSIKDGKILLSSEVLSNPDKFYLRDFPVPTPEEVLNKAKERYKEETGVEEANILWGMSNSLRTQYVYEALEDALGLFDRNVKTASLWYGRR